MSRKINIITLLMIYASEKYAHIENLYYFTENLENMLKYRNNNFKKLINIRRSSILLISEGVFTDYLLWYFYIIGKNLSAFFFFFVC